MDRDMDLNERLSQSSARFMVTMSRILEKYNHPFEDDLLISIDTLTYDTPDGPKRWEQVSPMEVKEWKEEILEHNRGSKRKTEKSKRKTSDFEDGHSSSVHQESSENSYVDTSDIDEESDVETASVRRKLEDVHLQNLHVDDGKIQKKVKVRVDVIVQEDARNIPKWIEVTPPGFSGGHRLSSPVQERIGNQVAVCRKQLELSNEYSPSRTLQLRYSGVPFPSNTVTIPRHRPSPELNETCCDSILEYHQCAGGGCSWSNVTIADLYPAMVEIIKRLVTKQCRRKELKYMFGHLRSKRHHSGRQKLVVTVDKIRRFRPFKLKKGLHSICSSRSEDNHNSTFENENATNENREFCYDNCLTNNLSDLVPSAPTDANDITMDYSDSSLEHHFVSRKGPKGFKQTVFPDIITRMGETFLVGDELQTTASLKNSECKGSEKLVYRRLSDDHFATSAASSASTALHLVKEIKTWKTDFYFGDTSELCSSACSSCGSNNTFAPVTNYSCTTAPNTLLLNPEKVISEGQISSQRKHSFFSLFKKQSPSKMPQKYEDAFEKLYQKACSGEIQKPFALTRPVSVSQNLEEKGRLVKSNFVKLHTDYDREFERIYEELCSEVVPKIPGFQRASNLRKYEGIKMSETVNALVNSPVQPLSVIPRVKRLGSFEIDLCSPVKRQKHRPEHCFSSTKCQEISHRKNHLQTVGMDFLSTYNGRNCSFFEDRNCQSQDCGFYDSSDKTFAIPGTSLQESGIADAHCGWPKATGNCSSPRNMQKCHRRVYRKLSYTDGNDQKA